MADIALPNYGSNKSTQFEDSRSFEELSSGLGWPLFLFMATGLDREKSKLTVASTAENASDSDRNSKSAAAKLAAKVERFKQSRKAHSETRIVGGVAINTTVDSTVPLSVQSSSVSVKSEPELDNIKDKVHCKDLSSLYFVFMFLSSQASTQPGVSSRALAQSCRFLSPPSLSRIPPLPLPPTDKITSVVQSRIS